MKIAKKLLCLLLALICVVSVGLTGCGEVDSESELTSIQTPALTTVSTTATTNSTTAATAPTSAPTTVPITKPTTRPTTAPTTKPTATPTTAATTKATAKPTTAPTTTPTVPAETVHTHNWKEATCTAPKTCTTCGATEGQANGHNWKEATCTAPKNCISCNATEGSAKSHSYAKGSCSICGAIDPSYTPDTLVWIPTNGGTKYHSKSTCSKMIDPKQVTKSEAVSSGFDPCGRCY